MFHNQKCFKSDEIICILDELIDRSLTALESLPKNYQDASKKLCKIYKDIQTSLIN